MGISILRSKAMRKTMALSAGLVLLYLFLVAAGCFNTSAPLDAVLNLGSGRHVDSLSAPETGRPKLVVMQHGLWRSAWSLWRLERALEDHGYLVLNFSYPSLTGSIEEHASRLERRLEGKLAGLSEPLPEIYFLGHSLGGLVIQSYLGRKGARRPVASVFLGTPHRGAVLTDLRKENFFFRVFMGKRASLELSPDHPFNRREIRIPGAVGTVVGRLPEEKGRSLEIPGPDDGTVAVAEARLPGIEDDSIKLPVGHTRLSFDGRVITQVLHFFRHHRFER